MATQYPYDSTALMQSNKIYNELHTVNAANAINAFMFVPDAAPFFGESMAIVDASGNTLTLGADYYLTHHWQQATTATGKPVYGSVTMAERFVSGSFKLTYRTIGGIYVDAPLNTITDGLVEQNTQLTLDWSTIPTGFPRTAHTEVLSGLPGWNQILDSFERLRLAVLANPTAISLDNISDIRVGYINPINARLNDIAIALAGRNTNNDLILELISKVTVLEDAISAGNTSGGSGGTGGGTVTTTIVPANSSTAVFTVNGNVTFNKTLTIKNNNTGEQMSANIEIYVNGTSKQYFSDAITGKVNNVSFTVNNSGNVTELVVINNLNIAVEASLA